MARIAVFLGSHSSAVKASPELLEAVRQQSVTRPAAGPRFQDRRQALACFRGVNVVGADGGGVSGFLYFVFGVFCVGGVAWRFKERTENKKSVETHSQAEAARSGELETVGKKTEVET